MCSFQTRNQAKSELCRFLFQIQKNRAIHEVSAATIAASTRHKLQHELSRRLRADDLTDEELDRIEKELAEDDVRLEKIEKELADQRARREETREGPLRQLAELKARADVLKKEAWRKKFEEIKPPVRESAKCSVVLEDIVVSEEPVPEVELVASTPEPPAPSTLENVIELDQEITEIQIAEPEAENEPEEVLEDDLQVEVMEVDSDADISATYNSDSVVVVDWDHPSQVEPESPCEEDTGVVQVPETDVPSEIEEEQNEEPADEVEEIPKQSEPEQFFEQILLMELDGIVTRHPGNQVSLSTAKRLEFSNNPL